MNKNAIMIIILIFASMGCTQTINSFEQCVAAGYPVMESYPRQCSDGTNTYVEDIDVENPAAVYCEEQGYDYTIVTEEQGQRGTCSNNGDQCDAWEFYRGECKLTN